MSVINSIPLIAAGDDGYQISRSVRFRSSASAYFNRTFGTPTSNTTWSWSGWVKRGKLGATQPFFGQTVSAGAIIGWNSSDQLTLWNNASSQVVNSTAVHRDPSAWYHVVVNSNGTTMIGYINGTQVFSYSGSITNFNSAVAHNLGASVANGVYFDGYLTEVNFIDGQALTPSSFGETDAVTGVWKPKKYTGTYGTNGFYLNFSDNSSNTATTIGKDSSGNGNNWTPNNISVTSGVTYDSMLDVPTPYADGGNGRGNYCTGNPLSRHTTNTYTLTNGNLDVQIFDASNVQIQTRMTMGVSSGKWYWEATLVSYTTYQPSLGVAADNVLSGAYVGSTALQWGVYGPTGDKMNGGSSTSYGSAATTNDVVQIALDMDNGKIWFGKNGTWFASGDPAAGTNAAFTNLAGNTVLPAMGVGGTTNAGGKYAFNFGQRPFAYTPPTGFKALNTQNLPDATIKKGNQYFDVSLYTGTSAAQSIVNSGSMQPNLVWTKSRNNLSNHGLFDSVRGGGNILLSDSSGAEASGTYISSFNSNGFSVAGNSSALNLSTYTYAAWQWKESVTAGFDIVTYTGTGVARTIAHSLGVKPSMIILKNRSTAGDWATWHQNLPNPTTQHFWLNATNAAQVSGSFNSTQPTSSVFSVGTTSEANGNGNNMVAYLFAEVAGFSRFGSYTGNGSTDGPFVFCGFKPRWLMVKRTDTTSNWELFDTARDTYNVAVNYLYPNLSNAESPGTGPFDFVSNGFKLRFTHANHNASGGTYIYAAFAENPFKNSLAR